jgi:hypothetical protein
LKKIREKKVRNSGGYKLVSFSGIFFAGSAKRDWFDTTNAEPRICKKLFNTTNWKINIHMAYIAINFMLVLF